MKRIRLLLFVPIILLAQTDFNLPDLNQSYQTLADVKGDRLTVVDFWATWCAPCVRSFPELIQLSNAYQDKGVRFVGINEDGPRNQSKVRPFVQSMKMPYTILTDLNGDVMNAFNITGLPTLLILDSNSKIVFTHEGFKPGDEKNLKRAIDYLLDESS